MNFSTVMVYLSIFILLTSLILTVSMLMQLCREF